MKKALVILLTLAVAGGLFAQTFTWSGSVEGGIGILGGEGYDDVVFGLVSPHHGVNGLRTQIQLDATNADGNAGFRARLRATSGDGTDLAWNNLSFQDTFAWVQPFGSIVDFRAGRWWDGRTATTVPIQDFSLMSGSGLVVTVNPVDIFTLQLGAYSNTQLFTGNEWEARGLQIVPGLRVDLGIVDIRAQLALRYEETNAGFGIAVRALPGIPIDAQVRINNLNDFGDTGTMEMSAYVRVNVLDGIGIGVGGRFDHNQVDDTDFALTAGGWVQLNMFDGVTPRLDLWYAMGRNYNYGAGFANDAPFAAPTWNHDDAFFSIRPRVEFGVGGNNVWTLGGLVNINLGEGEGVNFGIFTGVRANF